MERNSHAVASPEHSGPPSGYSTTDQAFEAAPDQIRFIAPHRLAQIIPGHAIEAPEDDTPDQISDVATIIGFSVLAFGLLAVFAL